MPASFRRESLMLAVVTLLMLPACTYIRYVGVEDGRWLGPVARCCIGDAGQLYQPCLAYHLCNCEPTIAMLAEILATSNTSELLPAPCCPCSGPLNVAPQSSSNACPRIRGATYNMQRCRDGRKIEQPIALMLSMHAHTTRGGIRKEVPSQLFD